MTVRRVATIEKNDGFSVQCVAKATRKSLVSALKGRAKLIATLRVAFV